MRNDVTEIVSSLIRNIGGAQISAGNYAINNIDVMINVGQSTAAGLNILKDEWPRLTPEEKQEIEVVSKTLKKIYSYDTPEKNE